MAYLLLDGTGDYASTAHSAALNITGDIDIRARIAPDDWTPAATQAIVAKDWNANGGRSWYFALLATGALFFTDPSVVAYTSSVATGFTDGEAQWVRAVVDVDDGGGQATCTFSTADGALVSPTVGDFSQLGTVRTHASTITITASTAPVQIGCRGGTADPFAGKNYRTQILSGIDGTLALDADFSDPTTWTFS